MSRPDAGGRRRNIAFFVPHIGCPHRCSFCDQNSITGQSGAPDPGYVEQTLRKALEDIPSSGARARTEIAFYGGSFTAVDPAVRYALLETASRFVGQGRFHGIRFSTRPDCIDEEELPVLRALGVTAIELGAQSMRDEVLRLNGRGHTARDVREASSTIRRYGFSLGLQMMTGLYGDDDSGAWETARAVAALCPETVRIYPTVVLRGTRLDALVREGRYRPPDVARTIPLCAALLEYFAVHNIRVIRLGLHAGPEVERRFAGGAYHPALRELCESAVMRRTALDRLAGKPRGEYVIFVRPADFSRMVGQKRGNILLLREKGYEVRVRPGEGLGPFEIRVE